jgi:hypothetical protein
VPVVAKKSVKKKEMDEETKTIEPVGDTPTDYRNKFAEAQIRALIERGKKRGYLTYEEMNDELPEEAVSPRKGSRERRCC